MSSSTFATTSRALLAVDPSARLTCSQALSHPYLAALDERSGGGVGRAASSSAAPADSGVRQGRKVTADPMDEDMPSPPARWGRWGTTAGLGAEGGGGGWSAGLV